MRSITKLTIKEAEKLRETGNLKFLSSELIPQENRFSIDFYLQKRAGQLLADVVGIPFNIDEKYNFYKTNKAQMIKMPLSRMNEEDELYKSCLTILIMSFCID